jgi:hypothetical protein
VRNVILVVTGLLTALAASSAAPLEAPAAGPQTSDPQERPQVNRSDFTPAAREAVDRGLAWLASRQNPNGSWTNRVGYKLYEDYFGEEHDSIDVTAIAGMAFVSAGHVPGRGKYGKNVALGVQWLLTKVRDEDGYITHAGSRMYSHAFATLFLAEIYGMTRQADIKAKLKRAVDLIVNSQNREGGWRYQPIPVDADLSVTVSTVQALRAARNVGIAVPLETIQRAMRYVMRCAVPRRGFSYQAATYDNGMNDTRVSFALTACGLVAMYSAGMYDSREVREGIRVLPNYKHSLIPGKLHYYYGHYYASQAMYLAGGDAWAAYYPGVRDEILGRQEPDGHWSDDVGKTYATAMACVVLQMPCEYLPIFQK